MSELNENTVVEEIEEVENDVESTESGVKLSKEGMGLIGVGAAALIGAGVFVGRKIHDHRAKKAAAAGTDGAKPEKKGFHPIQSVKNKFKKNEVPETPAADTDSTKES